MSEIISYNYSPLNVLSKFYYPEWNLAYWLPVSSYWISVSSEGRHIGSSGEIRADSILHGSIFFLVYISLCEYRSWLVTEWTMEHESFSNVRRWRDGTEFQLVVWFRTAPLVQADSIRTSGLPVRGQREPARVHWSEQILLRRFRGPGA